MFSSRAQLFSIPKSLRFGVLNSRQVLARRPVSQCCVLREKQSSSNHSPSALLNRRLWRYPGASMRSVHTSGSLWSAVTVSTPPFAESITEGDVKWEKELGDSVEQDEIIAEIETDKTAIPVLSPVAGVIAELLVEDGEKVVANTELCKIEPSGDSPKKETPTETLPPTTQTPPPTADPPLKSKQPEPVDESPIPTELPPVPPLPDKALSESPRVPPPPATSPVTVRDVLSGSRTEKRVKMNRMRQRIAQRLKEAQNTNAMLTTFNEVDMSNIIEMRNAHKDAFLKRHGVKLGFMSPFVRAAAFALQDQPVVNAVIDGGDIVYREYVDISVAVATPKGLVVPVLRNVQTMNYADIEKGVNEMGLKAHDGTLAIEDMDGGTFTISNGGVFGSMFGTPIINPPQSAILGMHATIQRPVAIDGKVEIRPMMYVALTYDHRLIDGREAVTFLKKIKSAVEDPRVMLLDL